MAATIQAINHIIIDPDIRRGRPIIAGTTICVSNIAAMNVFHEMSPDEIAMAYRLPLAKVHAALSYYFDHKSEIDREMREEAAFSDKMKEEGLGRRHPLLSG